MNLKAKIEQIQLINQASQAPIPLILDLMRIKRSDYTAECKGLNFELHAGCHEWYTLYENVIREDYFAHGIVVNEGDTVIDIGANFGSFAAVASRKVGRTGKVLAFEPNPDVYRRLVRNLEINGFGNTAAYNEAVSGEDGEIVLYIQQRSSLTTTYAKVDHRASEDARPVTVTATAIKSILHTVDGLVDLLKIDCEGAEYAIFDSLDQDSLSKVRQITMEVHKVDGRSEHEIPAMLSAFGFTVRNDMPMITAFKAN